MKKLIALSLSLLFVGCNSKKEKENSSKTEKEIVYTKSSEVSKKSIIKNNPLDFVPKGYRVFKYEGGVSAEGWDEIKGDLNKDGLEDIVLVIKEVNEANVVRDENRGKLDKNRRGILVLLNTKNGYELVSKNLSCFFSENEDGYFLGLK